MVRKHTPVRKTYKDFLSNIKCTELYKNMFKTTAGTSTTLRAVITSIKTKYREISKKSVIILAA